MLSPARVLGHAGVLITGHARDLCLRLATALVHIGLASPSHCSACWVPPMLSRLSTPVKVEELISATAVCLSMLRPLLLQPMKHWYKPLAFYVAMEVAALLCRVALHAAGFQRHVTMGLAYYTMNLPAPPRRWSSDGAAGVCSSGGRGRDWRLAYSSGDSSQQVLLVLLHGIGMGLIPYISMLFNMAATGVWCGVAFRASCT